MSVVLPSAPATKGHVKILLQEDCASFDELDDASFLHVINASNMVSSALFELLGAHGTNILIQAKEKKVVTDVIARKQDDQLNFLWKPEQGNRQELENVAKQIKDVVDELVWIRDNPDVAKKQDGVAGQQKITLESSQKGSKEGKEENYLLRSLRRIP